jgi:N utilization substance protein B
MSNRHLSRSVAMQSLFEWDFNGCDDSKIEEIVLRNSEEFAPGMAEHSFVLSLVQNVLKHRATIDEIIEKAAPDWPLAQISIVDRNVLRIGLYELLFADRKEVPSKVAINEAIELAKTFGGDTSGKFVNGVLGAVYKEMGEPGKDETGRKQKKEEEAVDIESLPIQKLGGAVVYARMDEEIYVALVHDVFGFWTLPKGKFEGEEDDAQATKKQVVEEIGIDVEIEDKLGENEYIASHPEQGKIRKQVVYFLAHAAHEKQELHLKETGGLDDIKWFPLAEIAELEMYDDIVPIMTKAIKILSQKVKGL